MTCPTGGGRGGQVHHALGRSQVACFKIGKLWDSVTLSPNILNRVGKVKMPLKISYKLSLMTHHLHYQVEVVAIVLPEWQSPQVFRALLSSSFFTALCCQGALNCCLHREDP